MQVRAGAGQRAAQRSVHLAVVVPAAGQRLGGGIAGQDDGVVLEVLPHAGQVRDRADTQGAQPGGRADAGQQQQVRGADRARAHDHLPGGVRLGWRSLVQVADARTAPVPHLQAGDQAAGLDGQVRAGQGEGQVGIGRADPPAAGDGQVGPGHPLLLRAAEVRGHRAADAGQRRSERDRDRVPAGLGDRADPDRAAGPAQRRVPARSRGVLTAPEPGQQLLVPPPGGPGGGPAVVDRAVAADVGHGVDRAGPAQAPAPGVGHRPGIGLGAGEAGPVRRGAQQGGPGVRDGHGRGPLGAAGFEQQHPGAGVLGEPGGQYAAGRARPHDDVVELGHGVSFHGRSGAVTGPSSPR